MKSILLLPFIEVQNANAITGFTHGFPGITNFLGFVHTMSRKLKITHNLTLQGCGVVCHESHLQAYKPSKWSDYTYSLTRNPLNKDGKTPSFVEEGRMHMKVSLVVGCDFVDDDFDEDLSEFEERIRKLVLTLRLAGGVILNMKKPELISLSNDPEKKNQCLRKIKRKLLPGFALIDRSELLSQHLNDMRENNPSAQMLDAWLDFISLKSEAKMLDKNQNEFPAEQQSAEWNYLPKPSAGWLVPIAAGYRAISELHQPGQVDRTRDTSVPFRFVESIHTIGEWISPHRIRDLNQMMWHYLALPDEGWYLCKTNFSENI